jgi:glycosyltransferase involved in cell wall biosynthesis
MVGISCICLTYGRVNFLEEALNSFLKQDYPEDKCELIILNDYAHQTLLYDHPNIRILNFDDQFSTIGAKVQFAVNQAKFDIIATWDDDDIALPNHLKNIDELFVEGTTVLHWAKGIFWNEPNITDITFLGNSGVVYSKYAIEQIGGIPLENAGYDTTMVDRIHTLGIEKTVWAEPAEPAWFYRWGFISKTCYHQSGQGTDDEVKPNILQRHAAHIETMRQQGMIPTGVINLTPVWHADYEQQYKTFKDGTSRTSSIHEVRKGQIP